MGFAHLPDLNFIPKNMANKIIHTIYFLASESIFLFMEW